MPYLEKLGYCHDFNQPWEGTGEDYTELSPRMAQLLPPFPESPLKHKNLEDPKLLGNKDLETKTHFQYTRFWIRPLKNILTILHSSPQFVCRQWKPDSGVPRLKWIVHEKFVPGSVVSYSVKTLESEICHCTYYSNQSVNCGQVANALWTWAFAVTPRLFIPAAVEDSIWPAKTSPRREWELRSTRRRAERHDHNIY
ncbi:hypothetical protein B0H10DRAFT_1951639 [Mycena sp. CBHHK59/15]|nr:hypothetical protein B0H10DRAFT_1951639 [Mycena sp. CBHHK59/15]